MNYNTIILGNFEDAFRPQARKINYQDIDDVKQSAILRMLTELKRLKEEESYEIPESKLFNFAYTIIQRTIVDHYRRKNRKIEKASVYTPFHPFGETSYSEKTVIEEQMYSSSLIIQDHGFDVAVLRADFSQNFDRFSKQEQKVISLMLDSEDGQGMNLTELARELGINKSHATRALSKLRLVCGL